MGIRRLTPGLHLAAMWRVKGDTVWTRLSHPQQVIVVIVGGLALWLLSSYLVGASTDPVFSGRGVPR